MELKTFSDLNLQRNQTIRSYNPSMDVLLSSCCFLFFTCVLNKKKSTLQKAISLNQFKTHKRCLCSSEPLCTQTTTQMVETLRVPQIVQFNFLLRGALETFLNETFSGQTKVKSQSLLTRVSAPTHICTWTELNNVV